jgi:hypothetical protein
LAEDDVAGVEHAGVRHVDDDVAGGVGGAGLDEFDPPGADFEFDGLFEGGVRARQFGAGEVELAEVLEEVGAQRFGAGGHRGGEYGRGYLVVEGVGACSARDELYRFGQGPPRRRSGRRFRVSVRSG